MYNNTTLIFDLKELFKSWQIFVDKKPPSYAFYLAPYTKLLNIHKGCIKKILIMHSSMINHIWYGYKIFMIGYVFFSKIHNYKTIIILSSYTLLKVVNGLKKAAIPSGIKPLFK